MNVLLLQVKALSRRLDQATKIEDQSLDHAFLFLARIVFGGVLVRGQARNPERYQATVGMPRGAGKICQSMGEPTFFFQEALAVFVTHLCWLPKTLDKPRFLSRIPVPRLGILVVARGCKCRVCKTPRGGRVWKRPPWDLPRPPFLRFEVCAGSDPWIELAAGLVVLVTSSINCCLFYLLCARS